MTHTPTPLDPINIPIGSPGQPLFNGHLAAHSQIRDEIMVNAAAIAALPAQASGQVTTVLTASTASAPVTATVSGRPVRHHPQRPGIAGYQYLGLRPLAGCHTRQRPDCQHDPGSLIADHHRVLASHPRIRKRPMTVTCTTAGCTNAGHPIEVPEPDDRNGWTIVCGVCGVVIVRHDEEGQPMNQGAR